MKSFIFLFCLLSVARASLPLGTVTSSSASCTTGFPSGFACRTFTVNAPGNVAITGIYGWRTPSVPIAGTILLHSGGGGTGLFNNGYVNLYFNTYKFRVALIKWDSDWENTGLSVKSIKLGAGRFATLVEKDLYARVHPEGDSLPFCGHGHSGGSGIFGYYLAHYNGTKTFDKILLSAGPVFGRVDQGCKVPNVGPVNVCPNGQHGCTQQPGYSGQPQYGGGTNCGVTSGMGLWVGAPCNCISGGNTSPAQNQAWWDMSVVSTGASFYYPQTAVSQWVCIPPPDNNAAEQGQYFASQMFAGQTAGFKQALVADCSGAETIWTGTFEGGTGLAKSAAHMASQCIARHSE